jgi:hypothetical protein
MSREIFIGTERSKSMALFSRYESLSYFLEKFINKIAVIEAWHAAWPTDERIKPNLKTLSSGMTNKACLVIINPTTRLIF